MSSDFIILFDLVIPILLIIFLSKFLIGKDGVGFVEKLGVGQGIGGHIGVILLEQFKIVIPDFFRLGIDVQLQQCVEIGFLVKGGCKQKLGGPCHVQKFIESTNHANIILYFSRVQQQMIRLISSKFNKGIADIIFTSRNCLITEKFYSGQGGVIHFDLTNRQYHITMQTIWEDYSLLEIQGLTGVSNFTIYEENQVSYFRDEELERNLNEIIRVNLKIPEDYTLKGRLNGSLLHVGGPVGKKMRSNPVSLEILGEDSILEMGDVKTQSMTVNNLKGKTIFSGLTIQQGNIKSKILESKKIMISQHCDLEADQINIRSLIMFGPSSIKIRSKILALESISGASVIESDQVDIKRYYGGQSNINIKSKFIRDRLGIETGTGRIQFQSSVQAQAGLAKVKLGGMHKGSLRVKQNVIEII